MAGVEGDYHEQGLELARARDTVRGLQAEAAHGAVLLRQMEQALADMKVRAYTCAPVGVWVCWGGGTPGAVSFSPQQSGG